MCRFETKLLEIEIYCGNSCEIRGRNNIFDQKMGSVNVFDGKEDVLGWLLKMKAKLISKGYKSVLTDITRPGVVAIDARAAWDALADKAVGTILLYLSSDIAVQFENKLTPQALMDAVKNHYVPDQQQEIDRLEIELNNLSYAREDPVIWTACVRGLIGKLIARGVNPTDRQVRNAVLKALATEPEYKVRIEVIRQTQPNISLDDLWLSVGRLPYPLESNEVAFAAMKLTSNAKRYQKEKEKGDIKRVKCYVCGKRGHFSYQCPDRKDFDSEEDESSDYSSEEDKKEKSKGREKSKGKEKSYSVFTF